MNTLREYFPARIAFAIGILLATCASSISAIAYVERLNNESIDDAKTDTYTIDNAHTSIVFAVSHFGMSFTYGRFNECAGEFRLNGADLTEKGFTFTIKADSIDTNHAERDKHLRSPDFFDTEQFPEIKFVATKVQRVDGVYQVIGELSMLGKTKSLTMPLELIGIGKGPFGKQRAGYFTKFTVKRSDFGMDSMAGQVGDNVSLSLSFEGVKQPPVDADSK